MIFLQKNIVFAIILINYMISINPVLVTWSEFHLNYDFIAIYLCIQKDEEENLCQGSCKLQENLEKNDEQSKPPERSSGEYNFFSLAYHIFQNCDSENYPPDKKINFLVYIKTDYLSQTSCPDSPPPRLLCV